MKQLKRDCFELSWVACQSVSLTIVSAFKLASFSTYAEWHHRYYWSEVRGAASEPLLMMLHSSLLKRTLKGLRMHSGESVRKNTVQVRERDESFSKCCRNKELLFCRPLQGEGKGGKYTCAWLVVVVFFISPEVTTVSQGRKKDLQNLDHKENQSYIFSLFVLKSSYVSVPFLLVEPVPAFRKTAFVKH